MKAALKSRRLPVLLATLTVVGGVVLFEDGGPGVTTGVVPSVTRTQRPAAAKRDTSAASDEELLAIVPRSLPTDNAAAPHVDLFADRRLPPAPPVQSASSASPSRPVPVGPPPMPFTYIGKKFEASSWEVYLMRDDRLLIARAGSRLDDVYRIESIAPPVMTLTYLPLETVQTLGIGAAF